MKKKTQCSFLLLLFYNELLKNVFIPIYIRNNNKMSAYLKCKKKNELMNFCKIKLKNVQKCI